MRSKPKASGTNRAGWRWFTHRSALLLLLAIVLLASTAAAAAGQGKIAPDLANFPVHEDGTVDVIIQFNHTPQARHFEAIAARGGRLRFAFDHIQGAAYRIPVKMLVWLERHPDVAYVSPDRPNRVAFDDQIPAVMADVARQQYYSLDGTGIGVGVIDSGVYAHDDLQTADLSASRIVYSESFVAGDASTNDVYGHGTHVAGIIAGNGQDSQTGYAHPFLGLAPNANIINLRVLDGNGAGSDSQVIAAIERAIQLKSTYNIRVINLSLGRNVFESYRQDPLCQAVEAAWQAGIVVVAAAGNSGRDNSLGTGGYATIQVPGNDPAVITVGATKTNNTPTRVDDTIASYSSKGPTLLDHVAKPDLVAPGNRITSLEAPANYMATNYPTLAVNPIAMCGLGGCNIPPAGEYMRLSGTSMAAPVAAGAAALMIQQDPTLSPDTVKARMMKTAWKGYPPSSWAYDLTGTGYSSQYDIFTIGAGYLDVDAALDSTDVAPGAALSPTASFDPTTGIATLSNGQSVTWGSCIVWGDSIVWGYGVVIDDSVVWGNSVVWGDTNLAGNSVVWGDSIVWGITDVRALAVGEDGEN